MDEDENTNREQPSAVEELLQAQHGLDSLPAYLGPLIPQPANGLDSSSEPMDLSLAATDSTLPLADLDVFHGGLPTTVTTVEGHHSIPLVLHDPSLDHSAAILPMSELDSHSMNDGEPQHISPDGLLPTPLVDPPPVTVSPSEISKFVEVSPISQITPAEIGGIFTARPDSAGEGPDQTATDVAAQTSHGSTPQLTPTESGNIFEDSLGQEFIITLPFASNERPFYVEKIEASKQAVAQFTGVGLVAAAEEAPKASLKFQVESLFSSLFDMCDLPSNLEPESMSALSPKDAQKFCVATNSKFAFIWELLNFLHDFPAKVLLVSRSQKTRDLLYKILQIEGYGVTNKSLAELAEGQFVSPIRLVLCLSDEDIVDRVTDFDVVIGFDYQFKYSKITQQLATTNEEGNPKQPMVLNLCLLYAIDHIDLAIDKDMASLQRMAALAVAVVRSRALIVHPDALEELPHQVAQVFADQIKEPNPNFYWSSQPIPEDVFDFDVPQMGPTVIKTPPEEVDTEMPLAGRKRKPDEMDDEIPNKRQRSEARPVVDDELRVGLAPVLRVLGANALDAEGLQNTTPVPVALLEAMALKVEDYRRVVHDEKASGKELRKITKSLEAELKSYVKTLNDIEKQHRNAIVDRGKFELERNNMAKERDEMKLKLEEMTTKAESLQSQLARANEPAATQEPGHQPGQSSDNTTSDSSEEKLKAEVELLKRRLANMEQDLDYTRKAYQDASQSASDLGTENMSLKRTNADLEHRASDNLRQIHEINNNMQMSDLLRQLELSKIMLRDRERELERARDELRALKSVRRETRQTSVPRSPRLGMMSPRASRGVGGGSRGTSPAPPEVAVPVGMAYFNPPPSKFSHLREQFER